MALAEPIVTTEDEQLSEKLVDYPTVTVNVGGLTPHPRNYNTHPVEQVEQLAESLTTFGQFKDIVIWKCEANFTYDDGAMLHEGVTYLVCGHGLWMAAVHVGLDELTAKDATGVSPEIAEAILMVDNAAPLGSTPDMEKLSFLLSRTRNLQADKPKLAAMLARLKEDAEWDSEGADDEEYESEGEDTEPEINRADELQQEWQTETGQIWKLGEHRLMCGDSANEADVQRLMEDDKACLVFTDPPYGVAIGAKNRMLNSFQKAGRNLTDIKDDALSPEELKKQLLPAFTNIKTIVMADDCTVFVTAPQGGDLGMMMMMMMKEAGLQIRHVLIWKKNAPTFSMGRLDYDYQHEPILLTWGKRHKRPMKGEHRTSVWEIAKPRASKEHPTMKPVELVENALLNNSDDGDITFDAYLGSGTTLIASQNLNRRCRAIEISPGYVAVTLQRFYDHTGIMPELIEQ